MSTGRILDRCCPPQAQGNLLSKVFRPQPKHGSGMGHRPLGWNRSTGHPGCPQDAHTRLVTINETISARQC
eukprot:1107263-Pyramimonas_sp.AAC.1